MLILKALASVAVTITFFISILGLATFVDRSDEGASVWLIWPIMIGLCLQVFLAFYGLWGV